MTEELDIFKEFRCGVVIPVGPGDFRMRNLNLVLETLDKQTFKPIDIAIVFDGWLPGSKYTTMRNHHPLYIYTDKHEPGREQPRNMGVRYLPDECNYVWFLDSDCLVLPNTLHEFAKAANIREEQRILIGPYEWMEEGSTKVTDKVVTHDPRRALFEDSRPDTVYVENLGVALANFSGNLVWPVNAFKKVGGFWDDLYTGRCEDGELGIRAASMSVPMSLVKSAKAFHMGPQGGHGDPQILEKNARDVPMINERHPYVEDKGLIIADEDGKRFNYLCKVCGEELNTIELWDHKAKCYNE